MAPNPLTTSTTSPLQGHLREYHYLIIALISPNKILGASMYPAGSERPVPSTPFIDPLHPCFPPIHTPVPTGHFSLFSSTRPTYISMSLALAGLYRQRERRDRVLVFRAQWRKKGEGASKQQREREREWEGGDSEIERRKKHKEGENIREEHRKREGKEGRGDISYCSFLSLSLPSRLRGLLLGAVLERKREWERESEREEGWTERKRAECPFTGVASD